MSAQNVFVYVNRGTQRGYLLGLKKGTPLKEVKGLVDSEEKESLCTLIKNADSAHWVSSKEKKVVSSVAHFVVGKDYTIERLAQRGCLQVVWSIS